MLLETQRVRPRRILLVEDDAGYGDSLRDLAGCYGIQLDAVAAARMEHVITGIDQYDLVMLNYDLDAGFTGLEIAEFLGRTRPDKPLVMVSATAQPWDAPLDDTPSVCAVVNKWDGMDEMLLQVLEAGAFESV